MQRLPSMLTCAKFPGAPGDCVVLMLIAAAVVRQQHYSVPGDPLGDTRRGVLLDYCGCGGCCQAGDASMGAVETESDQEASSKRVSSQQALKSAAWEKRVCLCPR